MLTTAPAQAADASLCRPDEQPLFACSTGGIKQVAVCASADLSATAGSLQYRFGRPGAVELAHPPTGSDWRAVTRAGRLTYSSGGSAWLALSNGPYRYVVYSAIGRGWGSRAGVLVQKDGRRVAHLRCRDEARTLLGPDLFSAAAIADDEQGFDLP